ncbi:MAG: DUF2141 domain-containing protein [Candidatus Cloacimonadales bacterium]
MKKLLILLSLGCWAFSLLATDGKSDNQDNQLSATVEISQIDLAEKGELIVRIFYDESSWNDNLPDQEIKIKEFSATHSLSLQLPAKINSLALQIIHDANQNGKMDFRIFPFPKPTEGIGLSNNFFRKGRPRFSDAEISTNDISEQISIEMNYF